MKRKKGLKGEVAWGPGVKPVSGAAARKNGDQTCLLAHLLTEGEGGTGEYGQQQHFQYLGGDREMRCSSSSLLDLSFRCTSLLNWFLTRKIG